jgi:hypothetical protein
MGPKTELLLIAEIAAAKASARRGLIAVSLFVAWLFATWLGPETEPPGGWSLAWIAGAVGVYSLLTIGALVALVRGVTRLRTGVLRRVVSTFLAPFWMVVAAATLLGGGIWAAADDPILSVWLGVGTTLALVTSAYAAARLLEAGQLESARKQLTHAPSDVALRTWKREIRARLHSQ